MYRVFYLVVGYIAKSTDLCYTDINKKQSGVIYGDNELS